MKFFYLFLSNEDDLFFSIAINDEFLEPTSFNWLGKFLLSRKFLVEDKSSFRLSISLTGPIGSVTGIQIRDETGLVIWEKTVRVIKNSGFSRLYTVNPNLPPLTEKLEEVSGRVSKYSEHRNYSNRGIEKTVKTMNSTVYVFYATDRNRLPQENENFPTYNGSRSALKYGVCEVNIPQERRIGELPRPKWWKFEFKSKLEKHFMILGGVELEENNFFNQLANMVNLSDEDDLFVFIHGYNTDFNEAIMRTAQIAYDLGFKGAPVTYSWPSSGKTANYLYDEESIQYTTTHLKTFLKDLTSRSKAAKIHLIAHSMGNRGLASAISSLFEENFFQSFTFNQIILAAPDIDAQVFLQEIAPKIPECSLRTTLYASSADRALRLSRMIHRSIIRLGESGDFITCCDGIDTIDASNTDPSLLGHGYFASTSPLINDIYQLFNFNHNPGHRNLLSIRTDNVEYWQFK